MEKVVTKQPKYRNVITGDIVDTWDEVITIRLSSAESENTRYWQEVIEAVTQNMVGE